MAILVDGPVGIPRDLPAVAVGVAEVAGVPAPVPVHRDLDRVGPGVPGGGQDGIDLLARGAVVGDRERRQAGSPPDRAWSAAAQTWAKRAKLCPGSAGQGRLPFSFATE